MTRKMILLATTLCLLLVVLVGCDAENYPGESGPSFLAKVLEIHDTYALVQTIEGAGFYHVTRVSFGTGELEDIGASVGGIVNIVYTGDIMQTYPEQVFATSWTLVERDGEQNNDDQGVYKIAEPTVRVTIYIPNIPTDAALEFIYADDNYNYYLPSMSSGIIMLTFENGVEFTLREAIEQEMITVADLKLNGLGVISMAR